MWNYSKKIWFIGGKKWEGYINIWNVWFITLWAHKVITKSKTLGDYLIVAVSTDEFNAIKGKKAYHNYETRKKMLEAIRYVDLVIPETDWEQKINDVKEYKVDVVVMGSDWEGNEKFELLREYCEVIYLERTKGVSTKNIKNDLRLEEPINGVNQIPNI